jgi:hypothetical protein
LTVGGGCGGGLEEEDGVSIGEDREEIFIRNGGFLINIKMFFFVVLAF